MSLNDQLMEQIRQSTSVSDDYVFDGSNQKKRQEVSISSNIPTKFITELF